MNQSAFKLGRRATEVQGKDFNCFSKRDLRLAQFPKQLLTVIYWTTSGPLQSMNNYLLEKWGYALWNFEKFCL